MHKFAIGDVINGKVNGIQPYGVFVEIGYGQQGLIHISEFKHGYVQNLQASVAIGDELTAKIIDVDQYTGKISLSLRAIQDLDLPRVPAKRLKRHKRFTPRIGFTTLKKMMPHFIDEAVKKLKQ